MEKELKVLSIHIHLILVHENCYEEKMACKHTIFREVSSYFKYVKGRGGGQKTLKKLFL